VKVQQKKLSAANKTRWQAWARRTQTCRTRPCCKPSRRHCTWCGTSHVGVRRVAELAFEQHVAANGHLLGKSGAESATAAAAWRGPADRLVEAAAATAGAASHPEPLFAQSLPYYCSGLPSLRRRADSELSSFLSIPEGRRRRLLRATAAAYPAASSASGAATAAARQDKVPDLEDHPKRRKGRHVHPIPNSQYRGFTVNEGSRVRTNDVVLRQIGLQFYPGENVRLNRDNWDSRAESNGRLLLTTELLDPLPDSPLYELL
uniref:DUF4757 domain-containing protein n=1 Tax=Macrostomum lignano TaxID=282301 RepID=A0A1I8F9A5_9PLAT